MNLEKLTFQVNISDQLFPHIVIVKMFGLNPLPLLAIPPKNITNHKRSSTTSKKNNIQNPQLDKYISP